MVARSGIEPNLRHAYEARSDPYRPPAVKLFNQNMVVPRRFELLTSTP